MWWIGKVEGVFGYRAWLVDNGLGRSLDAIDYTQGGIVLSDHVDGPRDRLDCPT